MTRFQDLAKSRAFATFDGRSRRIYLLARYATLTFWRSATHPITTATRILGTCRGCSAEGHRLGCLIARNPHRLDILRHPYRATQPPSIVMG